jgi:hypothetical protein
MPLVYVLEEVRVDARTMMRMRFTAVTPRWNTLAPTPWVELMAMNKPVCRSLQLFIGANSHCTKGTRFFNFSGEKAKAKRTKQ